MRRCHLLLLLSLVGYGLSAQILAPIFRAPTPHYVDVYGGSNVNNGLTPSTAWHDVAYADAHVPVNSPLWLKHPDGVFRKAPTYWHTLQAYYPMVQHSGSTTAIDDVANGIHCTIVQGTWTWAVPGPATAAPAPAADCGVGQLGIGTGEQTVAASFYSATTTTSSYLALASAGALATIPGWAVYQNGSQFGYTMRSASVALGAQANAPAPNAAANLPHTLVGVFHRNSATGLRMWIDDTLVNSPGADTTTLGTSNLTNATAHAGIANRWTTSWQGPFPSTWISEVRVYSSALSDADALQVSQEVTRRMWDWRRTGTTVVAFGSTGNGISTDRTLYTSLSSVGGGTWYDRTYQSTYTHLGANYGFVGNPIVLCLQPLKCNGALPSYAGEKNWILYHESQDDNTSAYVLPFVATSYDGLHWTDIGQLPTPGTGAGSWIVDNDDPTDWHNVHAIYFSISPTTFWETHPTDGTFVNWSTPAALMNFSGVGGVNYFNPAIVKSGPTYYLFYSNNSDRYMYRASCTSGCLTATNNWAQDQSGNWWGLGQGESGQFIAWPGGGWRFYYYDFSGQVYTFTTDLLTFTAKTTLYPPNGGYYSANWVLLQSAPQP